ncbi:MarR family transcriptional regulator [Paenibacillus sp. KQZ6P-2]|uniref:MarR family transcriptional regulator n=1 Tax=Paenibacillus mangrovi TaxID=2931978 RepID=A0A9X2B7N2_9BACL|nr:MarR family transcriptional regulator [Paenibacillus mangrovi]MCJ8015152.1 MarR family transcriptional regulator [Paenibacillus mangrovi]
MKKIIRSYIIRLQTNKMVDNIDINKEKNINFNQEKMSKQHTQLDTQSLTTLIFLMESSHEIFKEITVHLSKFGLSVAKVKVLQTLFSQEKPMMPSELAKNSGVSRSTMTGVLDGLERDGFIYKGEGDDRRITLIFLSEAGVNLMNTLQPYYAALADKITSEVTKEEQDLLAQLLVKLKRSLEGQKG